MNTRLPFFPFALAVSFATAVFAVPPSGFYVSDGEEEDEDGNVVESFRPMDQKEFSDYIAEKYRGDYVGGAAGIEREQAEWENARAEWNAEHPDRPITSDEDDPDFDYGDDDGDTFGELTDEQIKQLLERKDLDDTEDPDDYGGIGDGKTTAATTDLLPEELLKNVEGDAASALAQAFSEDAEDGVATDGTKDSTGLEAALDDVADFSKVAFKEFSLDILSGGVDPASHSLAGLFDWFSPETMPLLAETDEARKKLLGFEWTEREEKMVVGKNARKQMQAAGWILYKVVDKKHNEYYFYRDVKRSTPSTLDDVEEPDPGWDWKGLEEVPEGYADEMDFGLFDWNFGGFSGEDSKWHEAGSTQTGPVIGDLHFTEDGLRFQYENDLSAWGLDYDDPDGAVACLFVKDNDGNWIGGKFEWISSSRTTRSFQNVFDGYNGWDLSNVPQTTEAAFVIVSKNGKWRSNVAVATWER